MSEGVDRSRLRMACVIVVVLVFGVPVTDALVSRGKGNSLPSEASAVDAGLRSIDEGDFDSFLDHLDAMAEGESGELPKYFLAEIGVPGNCRDIRVDSTGTVVGYVVDGDVESALGDLERRLTSRGWQGVLLGGIDGMTFVKEGGECTWALATCTQTGSSTSVVFRCANR